MYEPAMNQVYNHKQLITYLNIECLNNRKTFYEKGNTNTHICNEKLASETLTFITIMTEVSKTLNSICIDRKLEWLI